MIMFKRPITPKESQIYESLVGLGLEKLNQIVKGKEIGNLKDIPKFKLFKKIQFIEKFPAMDVKLNQSWV